MLGRGLSDACNFSLRNLGLLWHDCASWESVHGQRRGCVFFSGGCLVQEGFVVAVGFVVVMERKEAIKFATELQEFMNMKIDDFNKDEESFKFKSDAPPEAIEPFIEFLDVLNKAFPELDEKICEYSMFYPMEYLINVKKIKFIVETTIKNNRHLLGKDQ